MLISYCAFLLDSRVRYSDFTMVKPVLGGLPHLSWLTALVNSHRKQFFYLIPNKYQFLKYQYKLMNAGRSLDIFLLPLVQDEAWLSASFQTRCNSEILKSQSQSAVYSFCLSGTKKKKKKKRFITFYICIKMTVAHTSPDGSKDRASRKERRREGEGGRG